MEGTLPDTTGNSLTDGMDIINSLQERESIGSKRLESKGSLDTTPNMVSFEPIGKSLPLRLLAKCFCPGRFFKVKQFNNVMALMITNFLLCEKLLQ